MQLARRKLRVYNYLMVEQSRSEVDYSIDSELRKRIVIAYVFSFL